MTSDWWDLMACRSADPVIFDQPQTPTGRSAYTSKRNPNSQWRKARELCGACPVREQCLEYVLSFPPDPWADQAFVAGHTPEEINMLRRARAK